MSKVIFETAIGDIASTVHGDKSHPLIVVLHGYGERSSSKNWNYIYSPLAKLGYLVVGLDMPGFGKSPGKRYKSRSEYLRIPGGPVDVVDEIIRLLDKPTAYLLGYDWGAGIAISAAIKLNNEGQNTRISGLMLFHVAYTQQQENEIARLINPKDTKTLILWVDTEQNHPIKLLNNEWKPAFKGCDCEVFECRPYSPDKPRNSYQVISDQVVGAITGWLLKYTPDPDAIDTPQTEEQPVESKENEPENDELTADSEMVQSVQSAPTEEPEGTKESEVILEENQVQNVEFEQVIDSKTKSLESKEIVNAPEITESPEVDVVVKSEDKVQVKEDENVQSEHVLKVEEQKESIKQSKTTKSVL